MMQGEDVHVKAAVEVVNLVARWWEQCDPTLRKMLFYIVLS